MQSVNRDSPSTLMCLTRHARNRFGNGLGQHVSGAMFGDVSSGVEDCKVKCLLGLSL
jgi:hypothetical protein